MGVVAAKETKAQELPVCHPQTSTEKRAEHKSIDLLEAIQVIFPSLECSQGPRGRVEKRLWRGRPTCPLDPVRLGRSNSSGL